MVDKSSIFSENINVNNVFHQLYKAKEDKKVVKITTKPLYIYYKSEAEKREEERKRLEEERKRLEEEKKRKNKFKLCYLLLKNKIDLFKNISFFFILKSILPNNKIK